MINYNEMKCEKCGSRSIIIAIVDDKFGDIYCYECAKKEVNLKKVKRLVETKQLNVA